MRVRGLCLAWIGIALAGCWNPSPRSYEFDGYGFGYAQPTAFAPPAAQPETGFDAAQVTSALEAVARREAEDAERATRWAAERSALPVAEAVAAVDAAYARADAAGAQALIAGHPRLVSWDEAQRDGRLTVRTTFERRGGEGFALVSLSLPTAVVGAPALGVAIPPGTYAVLSETQAGADSGGVEGFGAEGERWVDPGQERRYGHWPAVQDLAFLNAGAVSLSAEAPVVTLRVPVACASFEKPAPEHGMRLDLKRFPAGSAVERLLIELCATRDEAPQPAEAQIAVWLARNRISWASFQREGGTIGRLSTFRGNQAISGRHARGAAALLLRSGTDPRGLGFFKDGADRAPADVPAAELAPQAADAPEPAQEPQAAPEEAQPTAPADPELSAAA